MKKTTKKAGLTVKTNVKVGGISLNHNTRPLG
jgi:hypothetical protein